MWPHVGLEFLLYSNMTSLMIMQANSLEHDIPEWSPTMQKPLSRMHLKMNEGLKDDNSNILMAK